MSDLERESGLLAQFFLEHYRLKLLALACAVALFAFVRWQRHAERVVDWPLVADLPAAGSDGALITRLPSSIKVKLRGPRTHVSSLNPAELTPIRVDLTRSERPALVLLSERMIPVTAPLEIVGVEPRRLRLTWARRAESDATEPRSVDTESSPADGTD